MRSNGKNARAKLLGRLLWTTGLVGSLMGGGPAAFAQTLPDPATDVMALANNLNDPLKNPAITRTMTSLDVTLRATRSVIDWKSFNVPSLNNVAFTTALPDPSVTVLNRIVGPASTQIYGAITAPSNVSVFIFNPNGILYGSGGTFSGGGLVLSTLNTANGDFLNTDPMDNGSIYKLAGTSTASLMVTDAGNITTSNGSFVAIGNNLVIGKEITATGGSVAILTASDVDLTFAPGSPLAMTINAGSMMGMMSPPPGVRVRGDGKIAGDSVVIGGASMAVANLLNVDAGATLTARSGSNGRVIIAAGGSASNVVEVDGGASILFSNPAGSEGAVFGGALADMMSVSPTLVLKTAGSFAASSDLAVSKSVDITAGGLATVSGNVTAGENYSLRGGSVILGNASASASQSAAGALTISATAGGVSALAPGGGGVSLRSDSDNTGAEVLSVTATGGAIDLGAQSVLVAGNAGGTRGNVTLDGNGGSVRVGTITANQLFTDGASDFTAGSARADLIDATAGVNIITTGAISVQSVNAGGGNAILKSSGAAQNVTVGGDITNAQLVEVTAGTTATGGVATVRGNVTAGAGYALTGSRVELGDGASVTQSAVANVAINAGTGGVQTTGPVILQSGSSGAASPLEIESAGSVFTNGARLVAGGLPTGLADQRQARVRVNSSAGNVTVGQIDGLGVALTADAGAVATTAPIVTREDITLRATTIALGDSTGPDTFTAGGPVRIQSGTGNTNVAQSWGLTTTGTNIPVTFIGRVVGDASFNISTSGLISVEDVLLAGAGHTINLTSTGSSVSARSLQAPGEVRVDAATTAQVAGAVLTDGGYVVQGSAVTLGSSTTSVSQSAKGGVLVVARDPSTAGTVTGLGALTLSANSDAGGTENLTISALGGGVNFAPTSRLQGSIDATNGSQVQILAGSNAVTLGAASGKQVNIATSANVNAAGLIKTLDTFAISTAGNVSVQDVETIGSNSLIVLTSTAGNVTVNNSLISTGSSLVSAAGTARVMGAVDSGGDYGINANTVILGNGVGTLQTADGGVSITAGAGGVFSSGGVDLYSNNDGSTAPSEALQIASGGVISLASANLYGGPARESAIILNTPTGNVSLANAFGKSIQIGAPAGDVMFLGSAMSTDSLAISTAGSIRANIFEVTSPTGNLTLNSTGAGKIVSATTRMTAGNNITVTGETVSTPLATATNGNLSLTANGGSLTLGGSPTASSAGQAASLTKIGTNGDLRVLSNLNAVSPINFNSGSDIVLGDAVTLTSSGGNISLTATGSIFSIGSGPALPPTNGANRIGTLSASGNVGFTGVGDLLADSIASTGGNVGLSTTGSVTGLSRNNDPGDVIAGGALSGAEINISAGGIARFRSVTATQAANFTAGGVGVGSTSATNLSINAGTQGVYLGTAIGLTSATIGSQASFIGVTNPSATSPVVPDLATDFGRADVTATAGSVTISGNGPVRQLDAVTAGTGISVSGQALTINSADANGGGLTLTATSGGLYLGTGDASTSVTLTKNGGNVTGNEVRVGGVLTAGTDAMISSTGNVRLASVVATDGNIGITTTGGDISGLALGSSATDGRLLAGFDRAALTASGADRTISVTASGTAQLGTVLAGTGTSALASPDQIRINSGSIDVTSAMAVNGGINLAATSGLLRLGSATSATSLLLTSSGDAIFGALTAGEDLAIRYGGSLQTGALTAGDDLIVRSGSPFNGAVTIASATSTGTGPDTRQVDFGGATLAAISGENVALTGSNVEISGGMPGRDVQVVGALTAKNNARVSNMGSILLSSVTAMEGDISISAPFGSVSGLALGAPATDGRLLPGFGRAVLTASGANRTIRVSANGPVQLGAVTAGAGTSILNSPDQIRIDAGSIDVTSVIAVNGGINLSAMSGSLKLGSAATAISLLLSSSGDATFDALTATEDLAIKSGGVLRAGALTAGDDLIVQSIGAATITSATSTGLGTDTRQVDFSGSTLANISGESASFGRSNVAIEAGGALSLGSVNAAASAALRSSVTLTVTGASTAGEDFAARASGQVTLDSVTAGDDASITSTAGGIRVRSVRVTAAGANDRSADVTGSSLGFRAPEALDRSNILLDAAGDLSFGFLLAGNNAASVIGRAGGAITGDTGTLISASEDVAFQAGGLINLPQVFAGDDIELRSTGGAIMLPSASAGGGVLDDRRANFSGPGLGFSADPVVTGRNLLVDASTTAMLGTVSAASSIGVRAGGNVTATSLTADEDIAIRSGGDVTLDLARARDDLVVTSVGSTMLTDAATLGGGADGRNVTFGSDIGFENSASLIRSTIAVDATAGAVLTKTVSAATTAVRSSGLVAAVDVTAGEDVALRGAAGITVTKATAGDDIELTSPLAISVTTSATALGTPGTDRAFADLTGASIVINGAEDHAGSNILANAGTISVPGLVDARNSVGLRATGDVNVTTGRAGEDFATSAGGLTTLTDIQAGDDIDVTGTGVVTLTKGVTTGAGPDTRRLNLVPARASFGAETLAGSDVATVSAGDIGLVDVNAANSIAARSTAGTINSGTSLIAGEDIALNAANDVIVTSATAGDDLILTAGRDVLLTTGVTTGLGADTRSVTTGAAITIAGPEATGLTGSNAVIDAGRNATLTNLNAKATIAARAVGDISSATSLSAGEDIALFATNDVIVNSAVAGDDLVLTAGRDVTLTTGMTTGLGADTRAVTNGTSLLIGMPEAAGLVRSNAAINAGRDASLASLDAKATLTARAGGNLGSATLLKAGEDVGLLSGGMMNATRISAGDDIVARGGTGVMIGSASALGTGADDRKLVFGGTSVTSANGEDAPAFTGSNIAVTALAGGLNFGTGDAAAGIRLDKQGADAADLAVTGDLNVGRDIALTSATDIRLAGDKSATSTGGSITLTAARSISELAGASAAPSPAQIGSLSATGNLTIRGSDDVRADTLTSGAAVDILTGGSVTGSNGSIATVTGGRLSAAAANQSVTVTAGNASGNVVQLREVIAGKDATIVANGVAINTLSSGVAGAGATNITAADGGFNLGTGSVTGMASLTLNGAPDALVPPLASAGAVLDRAFGASDITATGAVSVNVASGLAQLDAVMAGTNVTLAGRALTARDVTATAGALSMTASEGGLYLDRGSAGTTATLTKQGGAAPNPGDEVRVTTSLSSGGATTINSSTSARLKTVTAAGDLTVATTLAVTGLAGASTGTSNTGFGRADLSATGALTVTSGALAQLGAASAGSNLTINAGNATSNGAIDVTTATATNGALLLSARATAPVGDTANDGDVLVDTARSGTTATLTNTDRGGTTGNVGIATRLTAGTSATVSSTGSVTGGVVEALNGNATVTAAPLVQLATLNATGSVSSTAGSVLVGGSNAGTTLGLTATSGQLTLGTGQAGGAATLTKSGTDGQLEVSNTLTAGGDVNITSSTVARLGTIASTGGNLTVASVAETTGVAGLLNTPAGRANLSAAGATRNVMVTTGNIAQLGAVVAGNNVTVTAGNAASNGAVDVSSATATNGALLLSARATLPVVGMVNDGDVLLGTGRSGTTATLTNTDRGGTAGNVFVATSLSGGTNVAINSNGNATGGLVEARNGNLAITAGPLIQFDANRANGAISETAASIVVGAANAGSSLDLTATSGQLTLGTGTAGTTATLTKNGTSGELQVSTSLSSVGNVTITSATNAALGATSATAGDIAVTSERIAINGAMTTAAGRKVTLTNRATTANATQLGDVGNETTDFVLSDAELDRISTETLLIESGRQDVGIGTVSLRAATGSKSLQITGVESSQIAISGVVSEEAAATGRKVQIGGSAVGNPTSLASSELASTIFATATPTAGGRLILPSAAVELRAGRLIFGRSDLIADTRSLTPDVVAVTFVSRPNSKLYNSIAGFDQNSGKTLLQADTLTIRYTDFALFQNTAPAGLNGGVILGPSSFVATGPARLTLFSRSETPLNSIGLFGTINGLTNNAAGLLPNGIVNIREEPNGTVRITRSASRLNGCAIGAPEQGCLTTQSPPPVLRLFDERQALVFRAADDAALPFDPLISTNNESLFIDFGGVSLPDDNANCEPGAANCPPEGDRK